MDSAKSGAVPHLRNATDGEVTGIALLNAAPAVGRRCGNEASKTVCMNQPKKPNNLKTALIIGSIALMFFVGVIARRMWF